MDERTGSSPRPEPVPGGDPAATQPLPGAAAPQSTATGGAAVPPTYGQAPYAPPTTGDAAAAAAAGPRPRRTVGVRVTAVVAAVALVVGLLTGGGAVALAHGLGDRGPGRQQGPAWSDGGPGAPGRAPDGFGRGAQDGSADDGATAQDPTQAPSVDDGTSS